MLATAVLLAATAFSLRLEGRMRATQRPSGPARIGTDSPFRSIQPDSSGFVINGRGGLFIEPRLVAVVGFRHHRRFHIFFGSDCFSDPFFDPFFCRQFLFNNRFFFAPSVFLPYPGLYLPSLDS